ncbi:MAG: Gfo/Idh/MocA family oxidoreductase [Acidobacteria bacterium]|nr:Gfo/Idh/MocA family oxidoreductase [Acidobacteriota bacterium]
MSTSVLSNRRTFLTQAAAAPFFIPNLISAPPSSTVRLASFGAGGMAFVTIRVLASHPKVKVSYVAEVDSAKLDQVKKAFGEAKVYEDYRRMLDKERKNFDAVCVGTPDHMHAPQAMAAMQLGFPVYGQKPLAHDIYEVRRLTEMARRKKLVTQMGIQVHSSKEYKTAVKLVQGGAIGKIKEVHSWSEKKWGDMDPMPDRSDPVPSTLNWDLWLGVCEKRPYITDYYHAVNWRKRIDFGTATFGDMGCHIFDPVFGSLALTAPLSVRSEGPKPTQHNWAINTIIRYVFPGTAYTAEKTVPISWYDGDERPSKDVQALVGPRRIPGQGSIFIGTKGVMLLPHVGRATLFPEEQFKDYPMPNEETVNHYHQFVDAVMGNGKTSTSFDYAGPLTESVLLGPIATRFPQTTLEWNAASMKFKNSPEATQFVRRRYRSGWKVKGIS